MDTNTQLKKEVEGYKRRAEAKEEESEEVRGEVRNLTELNRQSHAIIKRLEERITELEEEATDKASREEKEQGVQTEEAQVEISQSGRGNAALLEKIAGL